MHNPPLLGHRERWAALARAFKRDIIPQTLLISGPAHCGKFTFARRYAQLLLCPSPITDEAGLPAPCGHCRVCHQVNIETFPDFQVFRPMVNSEKEPKDWVTAPGQLDSSIINVEMARKFGTDALGRPFSGQRKVMMLVQADRMNAAAQNALLKTFEEPGRSLSLVLLADNANNLLPTVLSRCWHLPLGLASDATVSAWLHEHFAGAPEAFIDSAVRVGAGRPGAAWREMQRLGHEDTPGEPRYLQASRLAERIDRAQPVGALGLTEEALRLARQWWQEDLATGGANEPREVKKADAKVLRSAAARFLDELANVYRHRWRDDVAAASRPVPRTTSAEGRPEPLALDQIHKTRHYILRNANTSLALDVLFGRLIALHRR